MKKLTTIALSLLAGSALVSGAFADATKAAPATAQPAKTAATAQNNTADASYTIGYSIGKNMTEQLKQQNVSLNTDDLQQGFVAGIEGSKPKLSQEQMEQSMQAFQKEMEAKMKAHEEAAEAEAARAKAKLDAAKAQTATTAADTAKTPADSAKKAVDATSAAAN
ncbi:FKBP-type peptidyl-prolyl cis-trans isomerase N-terminal domain-containing protein [Cysteiniphilum sp. QT6929]|uniref:FKBP-type peptidyl-prolyl cis-trans isomerase N-terminal domain-containing protein n=1 Tax=Cysteiniphilum sp. QT6929 TaxID=2975055 RepID=UPI0024B3B257|nr:FKBP-type peptidyl-prolyl cis-trans isomerase N-terminal domain-containing protein [Cysteiniphilum sp. QT6929]WHN65456.1 FKBP-type peptidyl-prolyl cis-trans isomerase N-terminal domain-containing protein [Cysteiniphilum sp. QT6929]